ncbi:MAG: hypothetical protein H6868_01730 [Rhodospirillales bacterium]|nr:hypothetical protein [Rhodospirillales bacterium]
MGKTIKTFIADNKARDYGKSIGAFVKHAAGICHLVKNRQGMIYLYSPLQQDKEEKTVLLGAVIPEGQPAAPYPVLQPCEVEDIQDPARFLQNIIPALQKGHGFHCAERGVRIIPVRLFDKFKKHYPLIRTTEDLNPLTNPYAKSEATRSVKWTKLKHPRPLKSANDRPAATPVAKPRHEFSTATTGNGKAKRRDTQVKALINQSIAERTPVPLDIEGLDHQGAHIIADHFLVTASEIIEKELGIDPPGTTEQPKKNIVQLMTERLQEIRDNGGIGVFNRFAAPGRKPPRIVTDPDILEKLNDIARRLGPSPKPRY